MQNSQPSNRLAYLALVAAILSLSFSAMFVRWADAPGPVTGFYRLFFSTLILLPFFARSIKKHNPISRANILFPVLAGIFTGFDFALWNTSLSYTTAANATLLGNTAPLWVALATWLVFQKHLSRGFWLGLAFTLSGALLVMGTDFLLHPQLGLGDLMAIGTGIFYAGTMLATQRSRTSMDTLTHIWLSGAFASLTLFLINLVLGFQFTGYSSQTYLVFLLSALVSQIIGYLSITYALGHLPAAIVSPTLIGQPIVTALLAIPLLAEIPTPFQAIGGLVALAGIYIINRSHSTENDQPAS